MRILLRLGRLSRNIRGRGRPRHIITSPHNHRTPFGYTKILLASPVFRRSMAFEKSFMGMRSVITGCRSSLPALSRAVIWYQMTALLKAGKLDLHPVITDRIPMKDFSKAMERLKTGEASKILVYPNGVR